MTGRRKKPGLEVGTWAADGQARIVTLGEFERGREITEYRGADWLISQFRKSGKVKGRAVLELLAVIKRSHETFGDGTADGQLSDVSIPFGLLDVIGSAIAGRTKWQREQARIKKSDGARRRSRWQARADEIWRQHPSKTKKEVANQIESELSAGGEGRTAAAWIERKIVRRGK